MKTNFRKNKNSTESEEKITTNNYELISTTLQKNINFLENTNLLKLLVYKIITNYYIS